MRETRHNRDRKERGQSAVEFGLVLPIVLMLIFGIIEFGRVVSATLTANHCANELARYAIVGNDEAAVLAYAHGNAICPPFDLESEAAHLTIEINTRDWAADDELVEVIVLYQIDLVVPIIRDLFTDGTYEARGRATLYMENRAP